MTSRHSLSHLEPDDVASNYDSNTLKKIADDVDERSPHIDVLFFLSLHLLLLLLLLLVVLSC